MKSIIHDVNNWLPSVTMAVPSPMNIVMDISVSRIRSSSVATSLILGRRLDDGFRHWKARPTSSFIPSDVKLLPNLGSISSFELKCASIQWARYSLDSGGIKEAASLPVISSKRKTPKLYTSLLSENWITDCTLHISMPNGLDKKTKSFQTANIQ